MSMGKGKNEQNVGNEQNTFANGQASNFNNLGNSAQTQIGQYQSTAPGQMSPLAAADYGSSVENIGSTYQNLTQAADRQLGSRGFGNAPSGFSASVNNNIANQKGNALTGAYRSGLAETQQDRDKALSATMQEQGMNNPNAAFSGADTSFTNADNEKAKGTQELLGLGEAAANIAVPGSGAAASALGKGSSGGVPSNAADPSIDASSIMNSGALGMPPVKPSYTPSTGGFGKYASTGPSAYGG